MTGPDRLAQLEDRLRRLEDRAAVYDVIAAYGPLVDAGNASATAALWTEDGSYDVDTGRYDGHDGIAAMVGSRGHQGLLARGCAHLTGLPRITVDGDTAVAVAHSQLVLRRADGRGYDVLRATAHRWELVRTSGGWRVSRRTSRLLDGSPEARELLRLPVEPPEGSFP